MPAEKGRTIIVKWKNVAIAGVRTKGVQIGNEPIDITSDDDAGWRTLLDDIGGRSVNISVSGVVKDDKLLNDALKSAEDRTEAVTLLFPDGKTITGTFFIANYSMTGEYNGAATFECELQSSGAVLNNNT